VRGETGCVPHRFGELAICGSLATMWRASNDRRAFAFKERFVKALLTSSS
jgi:hypothetical protein